MVVRSVAIYWGKGRTKDLSRDVRAIYGTAEGLIIVIGRY